jgi:hypothetical protein
MYKFRSKFEYVLITCLQFLNLYNLAVTKYATRFNTKYSPFRPSNLLSSQVTYVIFLYIFQLVFLMEAHMFFVSYRLNFHIKFRLFFAFEEFLSVILFDCLANIYIYI